MNQPLQSEKIAALLNRPMKVLTYSSVDSTNSEAKRLIANGLSEPCLIAAETQTAGRGRLGRSFYSPTSSGLYMSLIFHPHAPASEWIAITSAAAVAVCLAIEELSGLSPKIKWVNDIYIGDRKICGILTEAVSDSFGTLMKSVIVGIGVNLSTVSFPDTLAERAASLYPNGQPPFSRNRLAAAIANTLSGLTDNLTDRDWLASYRKRSYLDGKGITYIENGISHSAVALGIDAHGGLIVENDDGDRLTLTSGEVTVRLK